VDSFNILILGPIFIILLVIIYQTVKQSQIFGTKKSAILSICVSTLATIGLNGHFKDSIEVLLLPYAAMAIAILSVLLFAFLYNLFKGAKTRLSDNNICKDVTIQGGDKCHKTKTPKKNFIRDNKK
jgi:TRAP-type C4-dicarboxylate transport system permease small subunit